MGFLTINPETANPDIIYVILVASLWIGVTATYIPGTGIIEGITLVGLVGSLIVLTQMPTNWLAALVLVVGVSFFLVMPFLKRQYAPMAIAGLAFQGIGSLFLFNGDRSVSIFVIVLMLLIPLAYHQLVLLPTLRKFGEQPVTGKDDMLIGEHGRVTKAIDPIGTVRVKSELWTAISEKPIQAGGEVVVLERDGLQLVVEEVKRKRQQQENEQETVQ